MSHTPVPEKLSPQYIPYMPSMGEAPLLGLIKTVDQLIDWAHFIEKQMREQLSKEEIENLLTPITENMSNIVEYLKERDSGQPSEVVRQSYIDPQYLAEDEIYENDRGTFTFCAMFSNDYPTLESAETARKMLLGNDE